MTSDFDIIKVLFYTGLPNKKTAVRLGTISIGVLA
jgi:hypothetical protein